MSLRHFLLSSVVALLPISPVLAQNTAPPTGDASNERVTTTHGTQPQTLANALENVVYAQQFSSSLCTGNDDTFAIQQAITQARVKHGIAHITGVSGTCNVQSLSLSSNTHVVIDAYLLLKPNQSNCMLQIATGASNIIIEGHGTLDGNRSNQTNLAVGGICTGSPTSPSSNITVRGGLTITNAYTWPVNIVNTTGAWLDHLTLTNSGNSPEFVASNNCWANNLVVNNINDGAFAIYGGSYNCGISNSFLSNSYAALGVYNDHAQQAPNHDILVANNTIWGIRDFGLTVSTDQNPGPFAGNYNVTLMGNQVYQNNQGGAATAGIMVNYASHVQIIGNRVHHNLQNSTAHLGAGIQVDSTTDYVTITGNTIYDEGQGGTGGIGIWFPTAPPHVTVTANRFYDDQTPKTMSWPMSGPLGVGASVFDNAVGPSIGSMNLTLASDSEVVGPFFQGGQYHISTGLSLDMNTGQGIEFGPTTSTATPFIDYHSSGNNVDYDVRQIVSGGSGTAGLGYLKTTGAVGFGVRAISSGSSDTGTTGDYAILWKSASGAPKAETITGCGSSINGRLLYVTDGQGDAASNNITITPASGTINGSATYVINANRNSVLLQCNSANTDWTVLASRSGSASDLTTGALNNIPVGATTPASGAFTTLSASGATILSGGLSGDISGASVTATGSPTARTLAARTADDLNLLDFVVAGDTDTTAAFNRAVARAQALGWPATLWIPCGIYNISSAITINTTANQGIQIKGESASCVSINQNADADAFDVSLGNYGGLFTTGAIRLSGMRLKMAASASTTRAAVHVASTAASGVVGVPVVLDDLTIASTGTTAYWGTGIYINEIPNVVYISHINSLLNANSTSGTHISINGNATSYTTSASVRDVWLVGGNHGVELGNYLQGIHLDNVNTLNMQYALYSAPTAGINEEINVANSYLMGRTLLDGTATPLNSVTIHDTYFDGLGNLLGSGATLVALTNVPVLTLHGNTYNGNSNGITGLSLTGSFYESSISGEKFGGFLGVGGLAVSLANTTYVVGLSNSNFINNTTNVTDTSGLLNVFTGNMSGTTAYFPANTLGGSGAVLAGTSNTSNGVKSTVLGGVSNTASGSQTVAAGNGSNATGNQAVAMGFIASATGNYTAAFGGRSTDRGDSGLVYSSGDFSAQGGSQMVYQTWRAALSSTSATRLTTDGGAPTTINGLHLAANMVAKTTVDATCVDTTNSANFATWNIQQGALTRGATNTAYVGDASSGVAPSLSGGAGSGGGGALLTIGAETTHQVMTVSVTWPNSNAVHCVANVRAIEAQ